MASRTVFFGRIGLLLAAFTTVVLAADIALSTPAPSPSGWRQHDNQRPRPPIVEPLATSIQGVPKDAVVLFDGKDLDAWKSPEGERAGWKVENGYFEVVSGAGPIVTKESFGDVQLHVEWASPNPPAGIGQDRGNSGIFLMGQFELQVLDSYRADTYADGQAGALYGQYPPIFNAARAPGEWQTYEVAFRRPRFDADGKLRDPARVTVLLNGILVQNNEALWGQTNWLEPSPYDPNVQSGPIQLQDHGHPVRFRNIWLRKLPERPAPTAETSRSPDVVKLPAEVLDGLVGEYAVGTGPRDMRIKVTREGDHLLFKLPFRPTPLRIDPISETVFLMPRTDGQFTFKKDAEGHVTGAVFQIGDGERLLARTGP